MIKISTLVLLRLALGWVFFWAFIDKLWGLGFATAPEAAWLAGGSPTTGFLTHGTKGLMADWFVGLAGTGLVDWLFMLGLAGVGTALILGVAMRPAAVAGGLMMLLIYLAAYVPPTNNPFMTEHIVYILTLILLATHNAGDYLGLGRWWQKTALVRRWSVLK